MSPGYGADCFAGQAEIASRADETATTIVRHSRPNDKHSGLVNQFYVQLTQNCGHEYKDNGHAYQNVKNRPTNSTLKYESYRKICRIRTIIFLVRWRERLLNQPLVSVFFSLRYG